MSTPTATVSTRPNEPLHLPATPSRFQRWVGSWRVAIRIARRDARRSWGRSLVVFLMIGVPVLALALGVTAVATLTDSPTERLPFQIGQAAARLSVIGGTVEQSVDGSSSSVSEGGGDPAQTGPTAARVAAEHHGRLVPTTLGPVIARFGDRRLQAMELGIDGRDPATRGMTELIDGRWPTSPSEAVVTPSGLANGLPASGTLDLTVLGSARPAPVTVTIVGTATGYDDRGGTVQLVRPPDTTQGTYLFVRSAPVSWQEVREFNTAGVLVVSREVVTNPPSISAQYRGFDDIYAQTNNAIAAVLTLGAIGLMLETVLLAGPAFAVAATRQRRTLALSAANGALSSHLRRYVLAQALVLGGIASVVAAALGVGIAALGYAVWGRLYADRPALPFEIPWWQVGLIVLCAVVSSVISAVLPARGLAKLDIVTALRGRAAQRAPRGGAPIAGLVVLALSAAVLILTARAVTHRPEHPLGPVATIVVLGGAAIALVVGATLMLPWLLHRIVGLASRAPVVLRLTARDAARQRSRAVPAVAAIMGVVAASVAVGLAVQTQRNIDIVRHQPIAPMGWVAVSAFYGSSTPSAATVKRVADMVKAQRTVTVTRATGGPKTAPDGTELPSVVADVNSRCETGDGPPCTGPAAYGDQRIRIMTAADLASGRLPSAAAKAQRAGALVATDEEMTFSGPDGNRIIVVELTELRPEDPDSTTRQVKLPAVVVPAEAFTAPEYLYPGGVLMPEAVAEKFQVTTAPDTILMQPSVPVDGDLASDLALIDPQVEVRVERGPDSSSLYVMIVLIATTLLITVVAALTSTALSVREQAADLATLSAVGATGRTRRALAATQAAFIAGLGALMGVILGGIAGYALVQILFGLNDGEGIGVSVPWAYLAGLLIGVPLLVAAMASFLTRREPALVRRMD